MKTLFVKIISLISVFSLLLATLSGCKEDVQENVYSASKKLNSISAQTVASNEKLELFWDDAVYSIMLRSKTSGKLWGTTPQAAYEDGKATALLSSPITISYANINDRSINSKMSYSACMTEGNYNIEKIENGIKVTYFYDDLQIAVPVSYILDSDSLKVSLNNAEITEGSDNKLLSVTLSPMMCSVLNNSENSYLFVPAGTGALMNTREDIDGGRTYSTQLYGDDIAQTLLERLSEDENARLSVFGVKDNNSALCAIAENSPGTVTVSAEAGSTKTGYSSVSAVIYTRGYDIYRSSGVSTNSVTTIASDEIADAVTTIAYYPLENEKADYNGMAECYRNYLIKKGMTETEVSQKAYGIRFFGNIENEVLKLGIPVTALETLTSFEETQEILTELQDETECIPAVQLMGYGESGIDIGKIADGFKFASKKGYDNLLKYSQENNVPLFVDFDLVFFNKSGCGISTLSSAAKSATMRKSVYYDRDYATGDYIKDNGENFIVSQRLLTSLTDKLIKKGSKLNITGYSLSTLTSFAYSDYSETKSYVKANIDQTVIDCISKIKDNGSIFASSSANDYAAMLSDSVFEVQTVGENTDNIDEYIPFYQMVFKGYTALYSESVNLSSNRQEALLSALESGTGLGFTIIQNYDVKYASLNHRELNSSKYSTQKEFVVDAVKNYSDYYEKIADAKISSYTILENGVTKTVFDNGIIAYTNKSDTALQTEIGQIEAKSFIYTENGVRTNAEN